MVASALLQRLEAWLRQNRALAFATMNPGLDESALTALERELGESLPPAVRLYLAWRDGQDSDTYECIPPDEWDFLPSRLIIDIKKRMDRDHQGRSPDGSMDLTRWWRPGFIPFLCDPCGGYMCLDSRGSATTRWGVVEFKHDTNDLVVRHPSFEKWLETVVYTLEAGLFAYMEENGVGIVDREAYEGLFRRLNPGLPLTIPMTYD
jgi:cell wall assembly regulator SMI1